MSVLSVQSVSYSYKTKYQTVQAVKDVSCDLSAGTLYALVGKSGSGKTTLLSLLAGLDTPSAASAAELPLRVLVPAFMTSELKRAFLIGFYLYIPFVLIDVIVASTLMSMGMIMLPPSMISMPFKLLLFIALNGWELLFSTLVQSFR